VKHVGMALRSGGTYSGTKEKFYYRSCLKNSPNDINFFVEQCVLFYTVRFYQGEDPTFPEQIRNKTNAKHGY